MHTLVQDLRYTVRMLLGNRGFTAVAVLTLALGIGANTAIFSVVHAVLLRPLPFPEPGRLLWVTEVIPQFNNAEIVSGPEFLNWQEQNRVFAHLAAFDESGSYDLTSRGEPRRIQGLKVSPGIFPVLGVQPGLGRVFIEEEGGPEIHRVVILTHGLWERCFGADRRLVGQPVVLNGISYTVTGILPKGFQFPRYPEAEILLPLGLNPVEERQGSRVSLVQVIGRLKPGIKPAQAQLDLDTIQQRMHRPGEPARYPFALQVKLTGLQEKLVGDLRPALLILLGAVGFVLLIACANVGNLLLARATSRSREMSIRAALGADRWRLARQVMTESLLLGLVGGALGLLVAYAGIGLLPTLAPAQLGGDVLRQVAIRIDYRVLAFTVLVSLASGILFGSIPALALSRANPSESLKEGGRTATTGFCHSRLRSLLVVSELAVALVLLIGAGLLIKSFLRLLQVDPGFRTDNVLTMAIDLAESKYPQASQRTAFFEQLLQRVQSLPGVQSAGMCDALPLTGRSLMVPGLTTKGRASELPGQGPLVGQIWATPGYLDTLGVRLLRGRAFNDQDAQQLTAVIVSESLARYCWPREDPIGKQFQMGGTDSPWLTAVGVVGDVRHDGLEAEAKPQVYRPLFHINTSRFLYLAVQTMGDPMTMAGALRAAVATIDRDQPVYDVRTIEQRLSGRLAMRRFHALLLGTFAALALVLAAVGVYGVMSYLVTQRNHEIGIRMALGARPGDVRWLVAAQGLRVIAVGLCIGLVTAFAITRVLGSFLFGVSPTDPATFAGVSLVLGLVTFLASYLPARRATKVDPMVTLRHE